MSRAILIEKPDLLLHLGDGIFDLYRLRTDFPGIPAAGVRGNCDAGSNEPDSRSLTLDGLKILMTHGHIYGVKTGLKNAVEAAREASSDVLLFGHTHRPVYEMSGSLHIMNPGSVFDGSYGSIEINDGDVFCRLKSI